MFGLVAVLWAVYLSECLVRWRPGDWVFRRTLSGGLEGVSQPDVTFWNERVAFVWTSPWPAAAVRRFSGETLDPLPALPTLAWLRVSAVALFLLLLVVFPALVIAGRVLPWLPHIVLAIVVAWTSTFVAFVRAFRRVHGRSPSMELWLMHAISPLSLVRAVQTVSIDASRETHPLVAADALCDDEEFLRIARLWHFDAVGLRPTIEQRAEKRGLRHRLLAPPAETEAGVSRFCRRCHATFKDAAQTCVDCIDVALTPLP